MMQENEDIAGENCTPDHNGVIAFSEEDKKKAWK